MVRNLCGRRVLVGTVVGLAIPVLLMLISGGGGAGLPEREWLLPGRSYPWAGPAVRLLSEFLGGVAGLPAIILYHTMPNVVSITGGWDALGLFLVANWLSWGALGATAGVVWHLYAVQPRCDDSPGRQLRVWSTAGGMWRTAALVGLATIVWPATIWALIVYLCAGVVGMLVGLVGCVALLFCCWAVLATSGRAALVWALLWGLPGVSIVVDLFLFRVWRLEDPPVDVGNILRPPLLQSIVPVVLIALVACQIWVGWRASKVERS